MPFAFLRKHDSNFILILATYAKCNFLHVLMFIILSRIERSTTNEAIIKEMKLLKTEMIDVKRKSYKYGLVFRGKDLPRGSKNLKKSMVSLILRKYVVKVKPHEISDCHWLKKGLLIEFNDRTEDSSYR